MSKTHGCDITVDEGQFLINGEQRNLYDGAVHYWWPDRSKWDSTPGSAKPMGFNMISIYIPWEIHEVSKDEFDFSGSKDIDTFLTLCESKGFAIVVRPGPQINSELTWFSYPKRILENERLQARSAKGARTVPTQVPKPIPAPNYTEDEFFDETALWCDIVREILARHAHPKGSIAAAQVDNEMAYSFCTNTYAADFGDALLRNYQAFLSSKYGLLEKTNEAHGTTVVTMAEVDVPRRFEATKASEIPRYAGWIEHRESYLIDSMAHLVDMMRERGPDIIALFHNYPHPLGPGGAASGSTMPFNIAKLKEKFDFVGFDIYSRKELCSYVKTVGSYVVGTSHYPYIPEFIAGVWPWYLYPGNLYDEELVTKAALAQGIKGFSRYMLVERDRWFDSPIRRDGRAREDHAKMSDAANRMQLDRRFGDLRRDVSVPLLTNREYDRLEAAGVLVSFLGDFFEIPSGFSEYAGPLAISEYTPGFDKAPQLEKSEWFGASYTVLNSGDHDFLLSDISLGPKRWDAYKVVVLTIPDYLDAALQQLLVNCAAVGGVVVMGPWAPRLDSLMQPYTILANAIAAGASGIVLVATKDEAAQVVHRTRADVAVPVVVKNDPDPDVIVHVDSIDPARRIVFVVNLTSRTVQTNVSLGHSLSSAQELWTGTEGYTDNETIRASLASYPIHIYDCRLS